MEPKGFQSLDIKERYKDQDDILRNFHIPVMKNSVQLHRTGGYFTAAVFKLLKDGLWEMIRRDNCDIKLIVNVHLKKKDYYAMIKGYDPQTEEEISQNILNDIEFFKSEIEKNHLGVLSCLITSKKLQIKVGIVKEHDSQGILHQKFGYFTDVDDNIIAFNGSENWTYGAIKFNTEKTTTFRNWKGDREERDCLAQIDDFNELWENKSKSVSIYELPDAPIQKMKLHEPKNEKEYNNMVNDMEAHYMDPPDTDTQQTNIAWQKYSKWDTTWYHCKKAAEEWEKNNFRGMLEMATGTGKTRASLECIIKLKEKHDSFVTIIVAPTTNLCDQWIGEIKNYRLDEQNRIIGKFTGYKNHQSTFDQTLLDFQLGRIKNPIIVTTYDSFSSQAFQDQITKLAKANKKTLLVCDEAHSSGAEKCQEGLLKSYDFRLGLSATPERHFDDKGTETIMKFFEGTLTNTTCNSCVTYHYKPDTTQEQLDAEHEEGKHDHKDLLPYKIANAIEHEILASYRYIPITVSLTQEELKQIKDIYKKIIKHQYSPQSPKEKNESIHNLRIKKWKITANAKNKNKELEQLITTGKTKCLIYCAVPEEKKYCKKCRKLDQSINDWQQELCEKCSKKYNTDKKPQYDEAREILFNLVPTKWDKYDSEDTLKQRKDTLEKLNSGQINYIISMNCLNEGIDVPEIETAIILASSSNPREYIQRRGRVLRKSKSNPLKIATIYDMLIIPDKQELTPEERKVEKNLIRQELVRYDEFMQSAMNYTELLIELNQIKTEWGLYE